MTWDDVRLFLAIARTGKLAAAARALSLDQTTLSRRLKRFEQHLGHALFESVEGYKILTPLGEALLNKAMTMEEAMLDMEALSEGLRQTPTGMVRIGVTSMVAKYVLIPQLTRFHQQYPEIRVDFRVSDTMADLSRLEVEVAVRLQRPTQGDYRIQKVGSVLFCLYQRADIAKPLPFAGITGHLAQLPDIKKLNAAWQTHPPSFSTDDADLFYYIVKNGTAMAYLADIVGDTDPTLKRIPNMPELARDVWLVSRNETTQSATILAVKQWVMDSFNRIKHTNLPPA